MPFKCINTEEGTLVEALLEMNFSFGYLWSHTTLSPKSTGHKITAMFGNKFECFKKSQVFMECFSSRIPLAPEPGKHAFLSTFCLAVHPRPPTPMQLRKDRVLRCLLQENASGKAGGSKSTHLDENQALEIWLPPRL